MFVEEVVFSIAHMYLYLYLYLYFQACTRTDNGTVDGIVVIKNNG